MKKKSFMPLVLLLAFSIVVAYGIIYYNLHVESYGTVKTIGVEAYWDLWRTQPVTEIDWDQVEPLGHVEPGTSKSVVIYIHSISNANTTLMMFTGSWMPLGIDQYITCTWDANGTVLMPNEIKPVEITLAVEQGIIEAGYEVFSYEILIEGSG